MEWNIMLKFWVFDFVLLVCVCVLRFSHYTSNKQIIRLILEEEEEDDDEENFFLLSSLCNATQRRQVRE